MKTKIRNTYTWEELDILVDTNPLALRDIAWEMQSDAGDAKRLLFKMIQAVELGRTAVNEVIFHSEKLLSK